MHLLDEELIRSQVKIKNVIILPIVHSTNQYLWEHIAELHSGDICVAEYQHDGRGRRKNKWFSPFGTNIYLSMYWCFQHEPMFTIGLSLMIAIVIAEILQELGVDQVRIKWPNDLYLNDRKLAGILIELSSCKIRDRTQLVIGIGINLSMPSTSAITEIMNQNWINLQDIGKDINRNFLIVQLIKKLYISLIYFERYGLAPFLSRWKQLDNYINRPVNIIFNENKMVYGISRGISAQGALLLEQNGIIQSWIGNDISLRSIK